MWYVLVRTQHLLTFFAEGVPVTTGDDVEVRSADVTVGTVVVVVVTGVATVLLRRGVPRPRVLGTTTGPGCPFSPSAGVSSGCLGVAEALGDFFSATVAGSGSSSGCWRSFLARREWAAATCERGRRTIRAKGNHYRILRTCIKRPGRSFLIYWRVG